MKPRRYFHVLIALIIMLFGSTMINGCDTGKDAVDEMTGNRALKQYHKSTRDIDKIAKQQAERLNGFQDEDRENEDR
jgi:hypothetical protein